MERILVVSPHADDAELGCGGYIAREIEKGSDVQVIVCAVGDVKFEHLGRTVSQNERKCEFEASMAVLGVKGWHVRLGGDTKLWDQPIVDLIQYVEEWIVRFQATQVLIPLPSSHQDHAAVYQACLAATRPSQHGSVKLVAAYEYAATAWGAGSAADAGKGGMYVDIEAFLDLKLEALGCYKSQIRDDGHCFSIEAARSMAKLRGLQSGLEVAELFHVMRLVI